jgi:hypothetical protein
LLDEFIYIIQRTKGEGYDPATVQRNIDKKIFEQYLHSQNIERAPAPIQS